MGFMLLFSILLYNPKIINKTINQILFILIYGGILAVIFLIPDGVDVSISSDGTQSSPVWSLSFSFTIIIILTSIMILTVYINIKILKRFKTQILTKKMKELLVGILLFYYLALGVPIFNFLNIELYRILFTISGFFVIIFGGLLLYYGVGRSLKDQIPNILKQEHIVSQNLIRS